MRSVFGPRDWTAFATFGILALILLSACAGAPSSPPVVDNTVPDTVEGPPNPVTVANTTVPAVTIVPPEPVGSAPSEVVIYMSDLAAQGLSELDFIDNSTSPGGKLIGLPNNGDELDPPPENDPHLRFPVQVQSGIPYRCWVHMKVGTPKGRSTANVVWVQFSDSVDKTNQEILRPGTRSYLTAQGPQQEGWTWVRCDATDSDSLVYFSKSGEVTVRIQAGAEGVGFDQFLLSSAKFLNEPPSEPIVEK